MRTTHLDRCNFCKSITEKYLTIKNLPIFTGVPDNRAKRDYLDFSIEICKYCGLIQQKKSELLDKKLRKIYLSKKALLSTPLGVGQWGGKRLEDFLKDANIGHISNDILEVGCGTGGLLFELFKKGCKNLSCFEPSSIAKKIPKLDKDFSPKIYNEFFSLKAVKKNKLVGKYNLIILTAVLEHIKDIKDFLAAIHFALRKEGTTVITVPNELFSFRMVDPGLMAHEHLNYFTPRTLETILFAAGFKILNLKKKKDLLLVKFKKKSRFSNKINQRLISSVINENRFILRNYLKNLPKIISKFKFLINTYKGERIGLYGACLTSFNLLSLSDLDEFKVKNLFFIDSDPLKWHKNLFGIPIIPPSELLKHRLSSILVIPPVFQDEIIEYLKSLNLPEYIKIIKFWKG